MNQDAHMEKILNRLINGQKLNETHSFRSCKFTNLFAIDVPSSFNFDHLLTFSCQLAQHSLTRLATSDKFLLGEDFGGVEFAVASFLDGVFSTFGDFNFLGEGDAILNSNNCGSMGLSQNCC